jgi:hypothetical protein
LLFVYNSNLPKNHRLVLNTLIIIYLSFACVTGDYGYMPMFLMFYVLMLGDSYYHNRLNSVLYKKLIRLYHTKRHVEMAEG